MTHARLCAAFAVLALPLLSGCGGAAVSVGASAPAAGATASSAEELGTVDGASAAVDHAERAIDELLGSARTRTIVAQGGAANRAETQGAAAPPPPPPAASAAPVAPVAPSGGDPSQRPRPMSTDKDEPPRQPAVAADACGTACGALASMERATDHLCGLAGADDARCTAAQARVKNAGARVRAACPVCSGS